MNSNQFLPMNKKDMNDRGWDTLDFLFISGDAYVDHPSFGHAMISRLLESEGYRVGMIAQPDWRGTTEARRRILQKMGTPRLGVLITTGVLDSMINNYTAAGRKRNEDSYSAGGKAGNRPDRALHVYVQMTREIFGDIPIIVGGLEPSLRRFTHYDYWENKVMPPVLATCQADIVVYGAGERAVIEIARLLDKGVAVNKIKSLQNTVVAGYLDEFPVRIQDAVTKLIHDVNENTNMGKAAGKLKHDVNEKTSMEETVKFQSEVVLLPSYESVCNDKKMFAKAFMMAYREQDPIRGRPILQLMSDGRYVIQYPPQKPLSEQEMDRLYSFAYMRKWHPSYDRYGGVPALEEVEFSITSHRGCFGGCTFCAIGYHQGRMIQARSETSIIEETKKMVLQPNFKGYIHDVGGPTANFRKPSCTLQLTRGVCSHKECLFPTPCRHLEPSHEEYIRLLRKVRNVKGVKKVFVRSGVRYDFALLDPSGQFIPELVKYHVSGQLKVAPEHVSAPVLACMGKPSQEVYDKFLKQYKTANDLTGQNQYIVPYFISGHPGSHLDDAIKLAVYLKKTGTNPEQVQQFIPIPGTLAGAMYWSGYDPRTLKTVYVPRSEKEQAMQRALLQFSEPKNRVMVLSALRSANRMDLVGYGPDCLIPPGEINGNKKDKTVNAKPERRKYVSKNNRR